MEKQISFIHAADLHLDSPFKGLANLPEHIFQQVKDSTFTALNNLVDCAIEKQVDFVLLVGDLFDNESQSLKAQVKLRTAFKKLAEHNINVYLSYGNHDYMKGNVHPITYPDNVFIFSSENVESFNYKDLAKIYGFSYEHRVVTNKKVDEYHIQSSSTPFHIAMLHGSYGDNAEHDTYAPFQLTDLTEKEFDYWALGHIHKREIIHSNPSIIYPGNIQGRNRKEVGEKGCYYVNMNEALTEKEFIPLHAIEFSQLSVDVSEATAIDQLENRLRSKLEELNSPTPQLIELTLTSSQEIILEWKINHLIDDVIEILNDFFTEQKNWRYIYKSNMNFNQQRLTEEGEHFVAELTRHFQDAPIQEYISELYQHRQARKFLDRLTAEEMEEIKKSAQELLIHELSNSDE
ncbi:metallophosphoesterase family protein [Ornithinibacillus halophilus]|uniref:DNA repair exonuclease SbcCD nuclease subunit n=1 Tax=Ornithinibacillus halophilus TaxID=930117 RepID=A0A1M5LQC2_9BACI|nr:DNA repair exonuclease [Ornithinibacillus halophilus]SHG67110.1 DNA repair exonuclease SbcCD nuclease subunit [Ornithinibacillus halophilus]